MDKYLVIMGMTVCVIGFLIQPVSNPDVTIIADSSTYFIDTVGRIFMISCGVTGIAIGMFMPNISEKGSEKVD